MAVSNDSYYKPDEALHELQMQETIMKALVDVQVVLRILVDKEIVTREEVQKYRNEVSSSPKYKLVLVDQIINNWLHFTKRLLVKFHRAYKSNDRLLDLHLLHQNIYKFCLQVPALY